MISELKYPYIPGERGFNLGSIVDHVGSGQIKAESGALVQYVITPEQIYFTSDRIYKMKAKVDERSVLTLDLTTKLLLFVGNMVKVLKQQPDFFAGRFIAEAMRHFGESGVDIRAYHAEWHRGSINYRKFMDERRTRSDNEAALRTWGSENMQKFGFNEVGLLRISDEWGVEVTAERGVIERVDGFFTRGSDPQLIDMVRDNIRDYVYPHHLS